MKIITKIVNKLLTTKSLTNLQRQYAKEAYKQRNCTHCRFLVAYVNWWCGSEDAIRDRGTNIPGECNCRHWKPDKKYIRQRIKKLNK